MESVRLCLAYGWSLVAIFAAALSESPVSSGVEPVRAGSWAFVDGVWDGDVDRLTQSDSVAIAYAFRIDQSYRDTTIQARFRVRDEGQGVQTAGLILRSADSQSGYFVHFDTRGDQLILHRGDLLNDANEVARRRGISLDAETWYTVRATIRGNRIDVYLDDQLVMTAKDARHTVGVGGVYTSQGAVEFRDIRITGQATPLSRPWAVVAPHDQHDFRNQRIATILERKVLCKQPGRYIGWPSIAQAANGDLLAVFSGDRDAHVSPDGKTQLVRSDDLGRTWSEPATIVDLPIDDRDAGIIRTRTGTILVSWFTGPPYHTELQGNYVIRSTDHGRTFSDPIRTQVTAPHGPVQVGDGRLLYLGLDPHCSHTSPSNYNGPPADSPHHVSLEESRDDGQTWKVIRQFPVPEDARMLSFDEPHLVDAGDGRIVAQFRDCNPPHRMWQSESRDGGRSWSSPVQTEIVGYPPHLLRLSNGSLLATYAKRWPPFGQFACISTDGGRSWDTDDEVRLSVASNGDHGYPASVQLEDGTIWTVYYEIDKPGEKPCLMATHWRLKN